ncbi:MULTISPECIES: type II toxin-antitoxin system HicB family antitoxin [Shewanella]|uniref:type II toxin-antitoxin system HicB family antitoxin n=1 Tax=Shewanella TaxID=22 RepID=UPI001AAE468F|nr:type II toxin-antitoxin system HicB family antitoxin [Shewanella algae]MBO2580226.1 type II toxin-antitoxin system HicB family antitoxin [Shewanella algae]HDS1207813.1 type II toxin-antitoxin system HicB family antitoxin [Shewanella algae]
MLFMVGVEVPKNDDTAFGIVVPAFESLGYSCFSAADEEQQILNKAKEAILDMAEEVLNDGHLLESLDKGYQNYQAEYPDFTQWIAIDVPIEALKPKQKRLNITLSESQLARIDNFVGYHSQYKDRSDFLAKAADNLMRQSA